MLNAFNKLQALEISDVCHINPIDRAKAGQFGSGESGVDEETFFAAAHPFHLQFFLSPNLRTLRIENGSQFDLQCFLNEWDLQAVDDLYQEFGGWYSTRQLAHSLKRRMQWVLNKSG